MAELPHIPKPTDDNVESMAKYHIRVAERLGYEWSGEHDPGDPEIAYHIKMGQSYLLMLIAGNLEYMNMQTDERDREERARG